MDSFTLQRQPQTSNILNNSLWPSSYYDSYWFMFLGASQNSCDELFWWAPTPISSIPPYIIPRLHKWMSKTFQNMGWVMDREIFIQFVKTLTMHHLPFGLLEVICGSCSLCTSECWVPMKIGCPLRRSSLEAL